MTALENLYGLSVLSSKMVFKPEVPGSVTLITFHLRDTDEVLYRNVDSSLARKLTELLIAE